MKIVRWITTLAVWSAALAGCWWYVVKPHDCNRIEGDVQRSIERLARSQSDPALTVPAARQNIARLTPCLACAPDVNRAMVLAANLRFAGRQEEAIAAYRDALRYDQRPELYLNLAQTQFDMGDETEGLKTLTKACLAAPNLVDYVPSRHVQMYVIVRDYYDGLVKKKQQQESK